MRLPFLGITILFATWLTMPPKAFASEQPVPKRSGDDVAPPCKAITLDELVALSLQHNPTLVQAGAQIEGNQGKALQAGLYPNPTIGYVAEQIGVENTAGEFQGGFVRQEIVTAGKLRLSRQKYLARVSVAEAQAFAQQMRVTNDVRIHYFHVIGAAKVLQIQQELLKTAEDNLVTVKEMLNVGQANQAELRQAQVDLQRQRLTVKMAQNNYRQEWETLSALVGIELPRSPLTDHLAEEVSFIDFDEALKKLIAESPQLAAARAKLRADQITVQREKVQPIPNVTVQGAAGYNFEAEETTYSAQVALRLPIFDRNQGTIRQAEADLARQHAEIRRLELWLKRELAKQYKEYLTALQHVQDYQSVVLPRAKEAYALTLKSYEARRATWPEVLVYQRRYFERRIEWVQHQVAQKEAEVLICGALLHNGLQAPPSVTPPGHIDSVPKPR